MQLVNMDVERFGASPKDAAGKQSIQRIQLGLLSGGLNAICGPKGSGKSTLLGWLRSMVGANNDYAAERYFQLTQGQLYPGQLNGDSTGGANSGWARNGTSLPFSGSLDVAHRGSTFRVQADRSGQKTIRHLSHADSLVNVDPLSATQCEVFAALASADVAYDSQNALVALAQRLGFDSHGFNTPVGFSRPLPLERSHLSSDSEREHLLVRKLDLESRLARLRTVSDSRPTLLHRQEELENELRDRSLGRHGRRSTTLRNAEYAEPDFLGRERANRVSSLNRDYNRELDSRRYRDRYASIEADLCDTLARIERFDRELAERRAELKSLEGSRASENVEDSYRKQLRDLDDRLNRWRQTLRDLKKHRDNLEHNATDAMLDQQIGEQLSVTKQADPRAALRSLETQILSARKQLDVLVDRFSPSAGDALDPLRGYEVRRDGLGRTRLTMSEPRRPLDANSLPETLRSMQKDLYEACQQLARHESQAASETLKQQSQQLRRCETELLQSVEKLIQERAQLLRKIADEHHLSAEEVSLAFGDWCDCHDHMHLQDWLLQEREVRSEHVGVHEPTRQRLQDEIAELESQRKSARAHAEQCRRQLGDTELHHLAVPHAATYLHESRFDHLSDLALRQELDRIVGDLRDWDDRERLQRELDELRQRLDQPATGPIQDDFRVATNLHIVGLMGYARAGYGRPAYATSLTTGPRTGWDPLSDRPNVNDRRANDWLDGARHETDVPDSVVRLAMRLAIADWMSKQAAPISLVLDQPLDDLSQETQRHALAHLAQVARTGQQIVVLTADERVAEMVRSFGGWTGYLQNSTVVSEFQSEHDLNRHLAAVANDYEMQKWSQPTSRQRPVVTEPVEFYLTERSAIEDLPSIDRPAAERCRKVGIYRVGELLDADPQWLAGRLNMDGIDGGSVAGWQAEAKLLCGVRLLRPFDARLLVGVGIRTPRQLAETDPSQLLDRVERFLTTQRGRRLMRSGTSYELSRITAWIASAKPGANRYQRSSLSDLPNERFDSREDRYEASNRPLRRSSESQRRQWPNSVERYRADDYAIEPDIEPYERPTSPDFVRREECSRERARSRSNTSRSTSNSKRNERRATSTQPESGEFLKWTNSKNATSNGRVHRFYLELASPIVDAPSIGPRMANRLEKQGILTVDQLLAVNPESLADRLNLRRVDADTIRAWQHQARLVCRIPNLRGHDAQLLVGCNYCSPEELSHMNPSEVLPNVLAFAATSEGQSILRGSKQPDLAEVTDWITWSAHCRSLNAA